MCIRDRTATAVLVLLAAVTLTAVNGLSIRKVLLALVSVALAVGAWRPVVLGTTYRAVAYLMLGFLLGLCGLELAAAALLNIRSEAPSALTEDYYASVDWGDDYRAEAQDLTEYYVPFVLWKSRPYKGRLTNTDDLGNRVTPGADCRPGAYKVFVLGGSAVWGLGVPDWGTLPAQLQILLAAQHDRPVCVENLGQNGWVSTQGVIELMRRLQADEVPDLVIFYDGLNDVAAASEEGVAGNNLGLQQIRWRLDTTAPALRLLVSTHTFRLAEHLLPSLGTMRAGPTAFRPVETDDGRLADNLVQVYLTNYRSVAALSREYGFAYAFFWQPTLGYRLKPLAPGEQRILQARIAEKPELSSLLSLVLPRIRAAARRHDRLFDVTDVFVNEPLWTFLAEAQITPDGNRQVASRIVQLLSQRPQ